MNNIINIAIDGPSGAGKSTIAKALAAKFGIAYLDTGAMYRAIGLYMDRLGINCNDEPAVLAALNGIDLDIKYVGSEQLVFLGEENVSLAIREHKVSKLASDVSKIPGVRIKLVNMQREIATRSSVVLDGRDITSYVLPNAEYKIYLDAKAEVRAQRRYDELIAKGQDVKYENILRDIIDRDHNDMNRSFAPLIRTADSIYIDSSIMTRDECLQAIMKHIHI